MASFLLVWRRATVDLKASYRRGGAGARQIDYSRSVVPEQTNRGVGPGVGLATTVAQIQVTGVDLTVPPPKKAKTEREDNPGFL
eukprot:8473021-Alexandrium_andersonii.AAC.1